VPDIRIQRKCGRQQVRRGSSDLSTSTPSHIFAAGGWWTRPSNWKANTAILFAGIIGVSYGVWTVSADKEVSSYFLPPPPHSESVGFQYRYNEPIRPIPSMRVRLAHSPSHRLISVSLTFLPIVDQAVPGHPSRQGGR
jgi:hypothetical protein